MSKHTPPTIEQAAWAAMRLVKDGMSLKHAVNLSATAFGYEPEDIYIAIGRIGSK